MYMAWLFKDCIRKPRIYISLRLRSDRSSGPVWRQPWTVQMASLRLCQLTDGPNLKGTCFLGGLRLLVRPWSTCILVCPCAFCFLKIFMFCLFIKLMFIFSQLFIRLMFIFSQLALQISSIQNELCKLLLIFMT